MLFEALIHPDRLRINSCGRTDCAPDWTWRTDRNAWTDLDLWIVVQGRGQMESERHTLPLSRGSSWILRGGACYAGHQDPNDRLLVSHTHFDFLDENGTVIPWQEIDLPPESRQINDMVAFDAILTALWRADMQENNSLPARIWLAAALHFLAATDHAEKNAENKSELAQAIDELCDKVLHEPGQWHSVAEMAQACYCGVDHFSRQFRQQRGKTPSVFLTMARMDRARSLLRYTTLNISQVANAVGYQEAAYFSRVFTTYHGSAPLHWRRNRDAQEP